MHRSISLAHSPQLTGKVARMEFSVGTIARELTDTRIEEPEALPPLLRYTDYRAK